MVPLFQDEPVRGPQAAWLPSRIGIDDGGGGGSSDVGSAVIEAVEEEEALELGDPALQPRRDGRNAPLILVAFHHHGFAGNAHVGGGLGIADVVPLLPQLLVAGVGGGLPPPEPAWEELLQNLPPDLPANPNWAEFPQNLLLGLDDLGDDDEPPPLASDDDELPPLALDDGGIREGMSPLVQDGNDGIHGDEDDEPPPLALDDDGGPPPLIQDCDDNFDDDDDEEEDEPPPLVQDGDDDFDDDDGGPPALALDDGGPPALVQDDEGPPALVQDDEGPPALVQDGNDDSDDDDGPPSLVMDSDDDDDFDDDGGFDGAAELPPFAWDYEGPPGTGANDEGGEDSEAYAALLQQLRAGGGAEAKSVLKVVGRGIEGAGKRLVCLCRYRGMGCWLLTI